jgi:hypothetical protein
MELVLGLAALATAVSGMAGVGHFTDASNVTEAEPTTVQKMNETIHQQDYSGSEIMTPPEIDLGSRNPSLVISERPGISKSIETEKENNDDFASANEIGSYNYTFSSYSGGRTPSSYSKSMYGSIAQKSDEDFYKFTVYGKANVTIQLTDIPDQCDYDIKLFAHGNNRYNASEAFKEIDGSYASYNDNERIQKQLYPNTYYVKVYSYDGYGSPRYKISVNVSYQRKNESISDLKSKGAQGALWLSDYDPYGIKPSISDSRIPIPESEYSNPSIPFSFRDRSFKHAEVFVFGEPFKQFILSMVNTVYDNVLNEINDLEEFEIKMQKTELAESVVYTIVGLFGAVGGAVSLGQWANQFLHNFAALLCPPENMIVTKTNYLGYLNGLRNALNWYNPEAEVGRVLSIPIMCRMVKKTEAARYIPFVGGPTMTTKTYLTYEPISNTSLFEYRNDTIPAQSPLNPITGTVYPILFGGDFSRALNERKVRTLIDPVLTLNQGKMIANIYKGEYQWLRFTAPHSGHFRIRSTGAWNAAVHVCNEIIEDTYFYAEGIIAREYRTPGYDEGFSYTFNLSAGETLFFRVCGSPNNYDALSNVTVTVTEVLNTIVNFDSSVLGLGYEWNDDYRTHETTSPADIYVTSRGAFLCEENGFVELKVDRGGACSYAFLNLRFDRPIKTIGFSTCIANTYSYAALQLHACAYDGYGDGIVDDSTSFSNNRTVVYGDYYLTRYVFNYDTEERDVGTDIFGVAFVLDPGTDESPYHVGYQEQWLHDFTVEFAD